MELLLFSSTTCLPCRKAKELFKARNFPYKEILVDEGENEKLVEKYQVASLPTLVLVDGQGVELEKVSGFVQKKYLDMAVLSKQAVEAVEMSR